MMFIILKTTIVLLSVSVTLCEPPATNYGVPLLDNNNYGTPNHYHEGQDHDHSQPKSYEFGYAVKDEYSGNDYKRSETSDGNQVNGEYRVQLPDGRTQIVTYYADWQTGFHADVRYEGTASYPDQYERNYNQYGVPAAAPSFGGNNQLNHQYGLPLKNNNNDDGAKSSVIIKDFSGPSTPYNTNNHAYGNNNQQYDGSNNVFSQNNHYDSYANVGTFGSKTRPSTIYGPS